MKGIDISTHNGTVYFNSVKCSGVDCVIMKATEGVNFVDDMYEQYVEDSRGSFNTLVHIISLVKKLIQ